MSPYVVLGSSVGTAEAAALCVRLTAWHDAMVAHERRLGQAERPMHATTNAHMTKHGRCGPRRW